MIPIAFDEENQVLMPPDGTEEHCAPLPVYLGNLDGVTPVCISCWKITREELEEIQRTARVYLMVMGYTMLPAAVLGKNPFEKEAESNGR